LQGRNQKVSIWATNQWTVQFTDSAFSTQSPPGWTIVSQDSAEAKHRHGTSAVWRHCHRLCKFSVNQSRLPAVLTGTSAA
jgi:hypothetical protein